MALAKPRRGTAAKSAQPARQTVLITGASSGIGEALARRFASAGFDLILVARSTDKLRRLAAALKSAHGARATAMGADLALPGAAAALAARLKRGRRSIDVLVNNAGVLQHGPFATMPPAEHQRLIDLNVSGLTAMLAQFVPQMVARGSGRVLNLASIAAFQPVPLLATYAATKAYVLSLTESMSEELQGSGVSIGALCPGITATNMLDAAAGTRPGLARLPATLVGSAEDVAEAGFQACMAGEVIRVPGVLNQAAVVAGRATPKWLLRKLGGALVRRLA